MVFQLTEALTDEILEALENQEKKFLVDAEKNQLTEYSSEKPDDDRFYELPEWNSRQGFDLRNDFVNNLYENEARKSLKEILHSGRGVFRNFKIELKNFPEVEKKWHIWKNRKMRSYVGQWYNVLREIWGLELLDFPEEENEELIHNDFIFKEYDSSDKERIIHFADAEGDFENSWPQEIKTAAKDLWLSRFIESAPEEQTGFVCSTLSNDFAGCITAAPVSQRTNNVAVLTGFFVLKKFRGLGIGSELLDMCLSGLKSSHFKWVLLAETIIPQELEPMLLRSGFEKTGSGYMQNLEKSNL